MTEYINGFEKVRRAFAHVTSANVTEPVIVVTATTEERARSFGGWQVIFKCWFEEENRVADFCREQPPTWLKTEDEVVDWARRQVIQHRGPRRPIVGADVQYF